MKILSRIMSCALLSTALVLSLASVDFGGPGDETGRVGTAGPGVKSVVLNTATSSCFYFGDGRTGCPASGDPDLRLEPWCTSNPGICGNWAVTAFTNLNDALEIPSSGYVGEGMDNNIDCQEVEVGKVLFFKLADGSFAKARITNDNADIGGNDCSHEITMEYIYPYTAP